MFSLTAGESGRIIGVTSTEKGEGKSTNSFNLALSMAETGKKILYLDCDLRLSVAAERADLKASPGLSNILVGLAKLDECIQQYKDTKLSVITAAIFRRIPRNFSAQPRWRNCAARFGKDMIISSPICLRWVW